MTPPSGLPTTAVVSVELAALLAESARTWSPAPVLLLSPRRLGIANTTLRRNFPETVEVLTKHRQTDRSTPTLAAPPNHNPESRTREPEAPHA